MNIARFEKRIIAYLIDMVLAIGIVVTGYIFGYLFIEPIRVIPWYFSIIIFLVIVWLIYMLINVNWLFFSNGRSLGALIVGIRVVHPNLERLTYKDCICRSAALAIIPMVFVNAIYMLVVHTEKTAFDRMSKTVVVDWRNRIQ